MDGAESSTFSAPPGSAQESYEPDYTFDGSFSDSSDQNYQAGDAVYDTFGISKIGISSSFITLYFTNATTMATWRSQSRTIHLEAPGDQDWEGSLTLGPSEEYAVETQFNYISYTPLPFSDQSDLGDWVVKTDNFGQLTITLF